MLSCKTNKATGGVAFFALLALGSPVLAQEGALTTQPATHKVTLRFVPGLTSGQVPEFLAAGASAVRAVEPVVIFVAPGGEGPSKRFSCGYDRIRANPDGGFSAEARLSTEHGTLLELQDRWAPLEEAGGWRLTRTVRVAKAGNGDAGFGTGFEIDGPEGVRSLDKAQVFIPGLWYADARGTRPSSLIHDVGQRDFLLREDRMSLPLVSLRDAASGRTATISHLHPTGGTIDADDSPNRVVDDRLVFGSLGILRPPGTPLRLAFRYPGTEGEQTSIFGYHRTRRTAERLHRLREGAEQTYELTLRFSKAGSFPEQMRQAWRAGVADERPQPIAAEITKVYAASISVLDHYWYREREVAGFPFAVKLPGGTVPDRSLQMGFVGQQLPNASYLLDEGIRTNQPALIEKAEAVCDFWAGESLSPAGVPRTWFDVDPSHRWRDYPTYLRIATDGGSGILRAWQIARAAGRQHPEWLAFARAIGDWLVASQAPDGSWARAYRFDGTPHDPSKTSTLHPVRFLIDLSLASGEAKYRDSALRAAAFSLDALADGSSYVGGTPDNPDVKDKEAGFIAMDSFLALYDVTRDAKFLVAAVDAATFTETWIYGWNVPLPPDGPRITLPELATTAGAASLIATGHSGADVFHAYAALPFARLALYTGDPHFAQVARLIQANTGQLVNVGGSLGYAQDGLVIEAFTLAVNRGTSVGVWLPWGTSAILEPMARSRDIFGTIDLADALARPDAAARNANWGRTRGYIAP